MDKISKVDFIEFNLKKEKFTFQDLIHIIDILRSKEGCPWDREQTHESLKSCIVEEAAELVASIRIFDRTGNPENLKEELGDILLQVVMHSNIAQEEGLFTLEDVIEEVARKMVRRHPHVFGNQLVENSEEVLVNWEEIKKKEKDGKDWVETPLRDIPMELPSLMRAQKVLKKVDKIYLEQKKEIEIIENLQRSLDQIKIGMTDIQKKEFVSETLFLISDYCRVNSLQGEQILNDRIENYIEEFEI